MSVQYTIYSVEELEENDKKKYEVIDYFPLSRVFVIYFIYTIGMLLTISSLAVLILLSTNLSTWVESLGDVGALIQTLVSGFSNKPDTNIGSVKAACFTGGLGSCTGANTVPDIYVPINPAY